MLPIILSDVAVICRVHMHMLSKIFI